MGKHILITGASGFFGKSLARSLLREGDDMLYLLARSERAEREIRTEINFADTRQYSLIKGDITEKNWGISDEERLKLSRKIQEVYHLAASTSFKESEIDEIERTNVHGTSNGIELVKTFPNLERFIYTSTGYVCGTDTGIIPEASLSMPRPAKNPYEEKKLKCEHIVINSGLPWTIVRPTIMMGNSKTGDAKDEIRMVYGYHLAIYRAALPFFTGEKTRGFTEFWKHWHNARELSDYAEIDLRVNADANTTKNLVTLDDVVNIFLAIKNSRDSIGKFYNVANPQNVTVGQIVGSMQNALHIRGVQYCPNLTRDELRNGEAGEKGSLSRKKNFAEKLAYKDLEPYFPYVHIFEPKWVDNNVQALGVKRIVMEPVLLDFLLQTYTKKYMALNGN